MTVHETALDPITLEVIGNTLQSIVDEMGEALIRSAYSSNIKERRDISTILFGADGQTLAQFGEIRYQAQPMPSWPAVAPLAVSASTRDLSAVLSFDSGMICSLDDGSLHVPLEE